MRVNWRRVGAAFGVLFTLYLLAGWYLDAGFVFETLLPARWQTGHDPEDVSVLAVVFLLMACAAVWTSGRSGGGSR